MAEKNNQNSGGDGAATAAPDEVEQLRAKLAEAEKARDENLDLARRTKADFENYQKRAQRDRAQDLRYAQAPLAFDILGALDNLDRAVAAAQQAGETGPLVQGVAMVQSQVLDVFRRHGVSRIDAKGEPFDPNLHQAVMQQPTKDAPPGTVLQVLEHGYRIHDRVLRPARVIVAAAPAEKASTKEE
jgi:molecular chaperone GrpE